MIHPRPLRTRLPIKPPVLPNPHPTRLRRATWNCGIPCHRQGIISNGASRLPPLGEGHGRTHQASATAGTSAPPVPTPAVPPAPSKSNPARSATSTARRAISLAAGEYHCPKGNLTRRKADITARRAPPAARRISLPEGPHPPQADITAAGLITAPAPPPRRPGQSPGPLPPRPGSPAAPDAARPSAAGGPGPGWAGHTDPGGWTPGS